jgi:hypothetical protein
MDKYIKMYNIIVNTLDGQQIRYSFDTKHKRFLNSKNKQFTRDSKKKREGTRIKLFKYKSRNNK